MRVCNYDAICFESSRRRNVIKENMYDGVHF